MIFMLLCCSLLALGSPPPARQFTGKEEVVLILSNPAKFGLVRTEELPPEGIANGTVYLCSKVRACLCVENARGRNLKICFLCALCCWSWKSENTERSKINMRDEG